MCIFGNHSTRRLILVHITGTRQAGFRASRPGAVRACEKRRRCEQRSGKNNFDIKVGLEVVNDVEPSKMPDLLFYINLIDLIWETFWILRGRAPPPFMWSSRHRIMLHSFAGVNERRLKDLYLIRDPFYDVHLLNFLLIPIMGTLQLEMQLVIPLSVKYNLAQLKPSQNNPLCCFFPCFIFFNFLLFTQP